jgi:hypothetical protein
MGEIHRGGTPLQTTKKVDRHSVGWCLNLVHTLYQVLLVSYMGYLVGLGEIHRGGTPLQGHQESG